MNDENEIKKEGGGSAGASCSAVGPTFELIRYNPRRKARGAEAAEVRCTWDGDETADLWMSEKDIKRNIKVYGPQKGLTDALKAYRQNSGLNEGPFNGSV